MKNFGLFILIVFINIAFAKKWDAAYISKLLADGQIDKVIDFYEKRYNGDDRDPQDAFRIADLYVKKKDYESAIVWYEKEKQLMKSSKVNLLNYANTYRLNGEYQKALDGYLMYAAETGDASKVMDYAYQCEKLVRATAMQNTFKLDNYAYNTADDERNVSVIRNNMIYNVYEKGSDIPTNNLKQSVRNFDNFDEPINVLTVKQPNYLITSVSYSRDGNKVVFSALMPNPKDKRYAKNESIFIADNLGGNWLNIKAFPFNSDAYSFKNPAFNSEGTVIYFSSNQTGGNGGFDIWESSLEKDKWTKPKNLGKLINTKMDEINPFLMQDKTDNTLYFSSNREGGFGGFDIYKSKVIDNVWQEVQMQPAPVNSASDDISIIYDDDIKTGYFSSDRKGGKGGFDVYRFLPFNLNLKIETVEETVLKPIDYAFVQLFDGNNKIEEAITDGTGNTVFSVGRDKNYTIIASKDGYKQTTFQVSTLGKLSGDSVEAVAQLAIDKTYNPKTTTSTISPQNYIVFVGKLIDASTNKPATKAKMRMVNYTTSRMRDLDIDEKGMFQIKLMLNNNYKIIIENGSNKVTDEVTTFGLSVGQTKIKDYLLNGNKFKMLENKIYDAENLPTKTKELYSIKDDQNKGVYYTVTKMDTATRIFTNNSQKPDQYYKIQLGNYAESNKEFKEFAQFGTIEKSLSSDKEYIYRLGDFYSLDDARLSLEFAKTKGYNLAFILQYNKEKLSKIIK
ncbi:MAG: hypothetical protein U0U67_07595 [Chitinophagales bacterium]